MSQRYSFRPMYFYSGGSVNVIARHPTSQKLLVGGDIEGVFVSEDAGDRWQIRNRGLYTDFYNRVAFVAWSETEADTAYIGVGHQGTFGGFFASTDGGKTWTLRSSTVNFSGNNNAAPLPSGHPRSTGNLLAQGGGYLYTFTFDDGVYRSSDNGTTWTNIGLAGSYGRSLVMDPSNPDVLYAATYNDRIYKTTNASAGTPSWNQLATAPLIVEELKFVGTYLYAACSNSGVFRSTDGGTTWDPLNGAFLDTAQSLWMSVDGYVSGSNHIVLVGCALPVTPSGDGSRNVVKLTITSGGSVTYTDLTTSTASFNPLIPPDNQSWWNYNATGNYKPWITGDDYNATSILIDPSNTNRIWVAGSEGIFRSTDGGTTWRPAINGMALTSNRQVVLDPNHSPTVWIGNTDWTTLQISDGLAQTASTTITHAPTSAGVGYGLVIDQNDSRVFIGVGNRDSNTEGQVFSRPYGGSYWIDEKLQDVGTLTEVATDTFSRTASNSWGTADLGGTWNIVAGSTTSFSVDGSVGRIQLPASPGGRALFLSGVSALDVTGTVDVTWDRLPTGDVHFTQVWVRSDGTTSNGYTFRIEQLPSGLTTIRFHRLAAGVTGQISGPVNFTSNYTPGETISIRFKAQGTNPTNLYMKAWVGGPDAEPTNWMMTATDNTAGLQVAGTVGIRASGNAAYTGGALFTYENFHAQSISAGSGDPSTKRPVGLAVGRDGTNQRVLLAGVESSGLWRKVNDSWTKVSTAICGGSQATRSAPFIWQTGSAYVYVFDRASGLYRSADYGATWTQIWNITSDTSRTGYIAQDPTVPTELWLSGSTGLFKLTGVQSGTVGTGITSTQITAVSSPGPLHITPNGHLYVATIPTASSSPQLLRSVDSGTTWIDISDVSYKTIANRPNDMTVGANGHIYVSTLNDGVLFGYSLGQAQTT